MPLKGVSPWGKHSGLTIYLALIRACNLRMGRTDLFNFLDIAVVVVGRAGLNGLDALVVFEQGGDLQTHVETS